MGKYPEGRSELYEHFSYNNEILLLSESLTVHNQ